MAKFVIFVKRLETAMNNLVFPLNLILLVLWAVSVVMLWRNSRESRFVRFMLSPLATYLSIGLFLIIVLVVGMTGRRELAGSWPFAIFMLFFQTVLAFVILRGWRNSVGIRWRFLLLHTGLMLTVGSMFWGAPDNLTLRTQAFKDVPVSEAYAPDGRTEWLDVPVTLADFTVSYGDDGQPSDYRAFVRVGDEDVVLRVNHPYQIRFGEDLYLSGYDTVSQEYCILQIVREPWRYVTLAGIIMILAGALLLFIGGPKS